MVVDLSQFYPRIQCCFDCAVGLSVSPYNNFPTLCTCNKCCFSFITCDCCYCCIVVIKLVISSIFYWRKYNLAIPIATFDNMTSLAYDCHGEIETFGAAVDLVHSINVLVAGKLWLLVTAKRKWNRRILFMCFWNPNKVLDEAFLFRSNNSLIIDKFGKHYCFWWN